MAFRSPLFAALLLCSACTPTPSDLPASEGLERPVTIDVGDFVLEGTLAIPAHDAGQTLPGIVLVHGTGPQSRDEIGRGQQGLSFSFEFPVFAEISAFLVDRGYAVLRYDKRSCGPPRCDNSYPGPLTEPTVTAFVTDGAMVADFLAEQPEIDPNRVAIAGHSQGGAMIPAMLQASPTSAVGISMAGPWSRIDIVAQWQYDSSVERLLTAGLTQAQIDADPELNELQALAAALAKLANGDVWDGSAWGSENFWRAWLAMDAARPGDASAAGRPMLAISGDYDWNVPPSETLAWEDVGVAEAQILPGLTHLFNYVSNPDFLTLTQEEIGRGVDPSLPNAIADFLDNEML